MTCMIGTEECQNDVWWCGGTVERQWLGTRWYGYEWHRDCNWLLIRPQHLNHMGEKFKLVILGGEGEGERDGGRGGRKEEPRLQFLHFWIISRGVGGRTGKGKKKKLWTKDEPISLLSVNPFSFKLSTKTRVAKCHTDRTLRTLRLWWRKTRKIGRTTLKEVIIQSKSETRSLMIVTSSYGNWVGATFLPYG